MCHGTRCGYRKFLLEDRIHNKTQRILEENRLLAHELLQLSINTYNHVVPMLMATTKPSRKPAFSPIVLPRISSASKAISGTSRGIRPEGQVAMHR